jgi:hypothetical protein
MGYILAFMAGGFIGVWTMCAMMTAKEADEREERWFDDERRSNCTAEKS